MATASTASGVLTSGRADSIRAQSASTCCARFRSASSLYKAARRAAHLAHPWRRVSSVAGSGRPGYVDGPGTTAELYFPNDLVVDAAGNIIAFGPDGRRLWSSRLQDSPPAGPPSLRDGSAWFLGLDGSIQRLSMSDGSPQTRVPLKLLPVGGPLAAGPDLVLPAGPGTLRLLDRKALGELAEGPRP